MKCAAFLIALVVSLPLHAAAQVKHTSARQTAPGTHVSLPIPEGFRSEPTGYLHTESKSSIIVVEVATPYEESLEGFTSEKLKSEDMILKTSGTHLFGNVMGRLLTIEQAAHGDTFTKVIGIFPAATGTALVSSVFPKGVSATWSSKLIETVKSARYDAKQDTDPFGGMRFTMTTPKGMIYSGRLGQLALFSRTGELGKQHPEDPAFMAGPVHRGQSAEEHKAFALTHLKGLTPFSIEKIETELATKIGGLPAVKLVAVASSVKPAIKMRIYQLMVFDKDETFMVLGSVGQERAPEFLAAFEAAAQSFKKRPLRVEPLKSGQ